MATGVFKDAVQNASFASPRADAAGFIPYGGVGGVVAKVLEGASVWNVALAIVVAAVVYDQCECHCEGIFAWNFEPLGKRGGEFF
jgi:hypothetical protein